MLDPRTPGSLLYAASLALAVLHGLVATAGLLLVGFGAVLAADDLSTQGDSWDGLGVLLGGLAAALGVVLVGTFSLFCWLVLTGRRRARAGDVRRLRVTGWASVVLALVALVFGLLVTPAWGLAPLVSLPLAVVVLGMLVAGGLTASAARARAAGTEPSTPTTPRY